MLIYSCQQKTDLKAFIPGFPSGFEKQTTDTVLDVCGLPSPNSLLVNLSLTALWGYKQIWNTDMILDQYQAKVRYCAKGISLPFHT